jgi:hypothetical protein
MRYLHAAIHSADVLASKVRTGNASQSPWPFRVHAQTGQIRENYCAHVVSSIELFDELIRLGLGNTTAYQSARQTAWTWMMTFPMQNNAWANYFEDVGIQSGLGNINQLNPMMMAPYTMPYLADLCTNAYGTSRKRLELGEPCPRSDCLGREKLRCPSIWRKRH